MSRRPRQASLALAAVCCAIAIGLAAGCAAPPTSWTHATRAQNRTFLLDGRHDRPLVYRDLGPRDAPLTLLCAHGLGSSKAAWRYLLPSLTTRYRVVIIDLPGHGQSARPREFDYSMAAQGSVLFRFALEHDLRNVVLVGSSYGGGAVLETARLFALADRPQRIRGLILLAAPAVDFPPPDSFRLAADPLLRCLLVNVMSARAVASIFVDGSFYRDDRADQALRADYIEVLRDASARDAAARAALAIFAELRGRAGREAEHFATITCPALLIWGEHDDVVPRDVMTRLAALLPDARCRIVPDCGHTPAEECPDGVLALIEPFLGKVESLGKIESVGKSE